MVKAPFIGTIQATTVWWKDAHVVCRQHYRFMGNKKWTSILLCGERGIQEGSGGFIITLLVNEEHRFVWLANGKMQYSETELKELPMMM